MSNPLLIVGADGLLGGALREYWRSLGRPFLTTSRSLYAEQEGALNVDLSLPPEVWPLLPQCHAAVLCAAVTSLDRCRRDPEGTRLVNVVRTLELAERLVAKGAFVVFLSSNLVFDGSRPLERADSLMTPRTEYGKQKAQVEKSLSQLHPHTAIIRLTKVLHPRLPLLNKWIHELAAGRAMQAYSDYLCSPISLTEVVRGIARVSEDRRPGLWQFSGPSDVSYFELALELARICGQSSALVRPAHRPRQDLEPAGDHTTLDASRARNELDLDFPPMPEIMKNIMHDQISTGH